MASAIDPTKPATGVPAVKADLRANLAAAKSEIEALQGASGGNASGVTYDPTPATGAAARTVQAALRDHIPSVKDFGAAGNSNGTHLNGTDDTAAIQAALNAGGYVFLPPGIYRITSTITIPADGGGLIGAGRRKSILFADGITSASANIGAGAAIRTSPSDAGFTYDAMLAHFSVMGTCRTGITCRYSQGASLLGLSVASGTTCTDAFFLSNCWGSSFIDLNANDANIDQDAGAAFSIYDAYQGNYAANWYCGGGSRPFYGIHIVSAGETHANVFNTPVMQGCRYGIYIQKMTSVGGTAINGLYTEDCVCAVRLGGSVSGGDLCRGVSINGSSFGGPNTTHPHYADRTGVIHMGYCDGISIQGCSFEAGGGGVMEVIQYDQAINVFLAGNYVAIDGLTTDITTYMKQVPGGAAGGSFVIFQTGSIGQSVLVMKENAYGYKHWKMTVNTSGAWTSAAWAPATAT